MNLLKHNFLLLWACVCWTLGRTADIVSIIDHLKSFGNNTAFNSTYNAIMAAVNVTTNLGAEDSEADHIVDPVGAESSPRTLKDEEKAYVDFVNAILRSVLPEVMANSKGISISTPCTASMMKVFANLKQLKGWSLKMLDSVGKPMSGILQGNSHSLGDFDQCLSLSITSRGQETSIDSEESFRGRYCSIRLKKPDAVGKAAHEYRMKKLSGKELGKLKDMIETIPYLPMMSNYMNHLVGLCLPSTCTTEDVGKMIQNLPFPGSAEVINCVTKQGVKLDYEQNVVLGILVFLGIMLLVGSILDRLLHFCTLQNRTRYLKRKVITILVAFSVFNNTKKLVKKIHSYRNEEPNCGSLRGLVVGTIICLIIGNTYLSPFESFYSQASHLSNLKEYLSLRYFSFAVCLPLTIETLFMSYGFQLTNKICKSTCKNKRVKVNLIKILFKYYLTLCIPLLICLCVVVLLPLFGNGPFWKEVFDPISNNCKGHWWRHVGMYSNFLGKDEQCLPHFWFVSCLMQIILISAVLLVITARWPKFGSFLSVCVVLGCCTSVGLATLKNDLPPTYIAYYADRTNEAFWNVNLSLPMSHFGSFAVGMLLGVVTARNPQMKIRPLLKVLGWILSSAVIIGLSGLLMFSYSGSDPMTPNNSSFYAAVHRTLFASASAWIVLACAYGYGSSINSVLSWTVFAPLYKLSYFAYLIHLVVIAYHVATSREHFSYSHTEMVIRSLAYIGLTYFAAFIGYLTIQAPLKYLYSSFIDCKFREINLITSIAEEVNKPANFTVWATERTTTNGTSNNRF